MKRIDSINVGQTAEIEHTITEEDLQRFVQLTGDDNKLHTDPQYAAKTSFKKPVAHGMLGASFISTIIGTKLPGDGALWFAQSLEFLLPVRVGDKLTIRAEVLKKDERTEIIELQTDIFNQHRQKVTVGTAKVKVVETESAVTQETKSLKPVALVIGGSGGIGSAICLQLAKDGFDVAVHYFKNEGAARDVAKKVEEIGRQVFIINGDINSKEAVANVVDQVVRKLGNPTALVNCATSKIAAIHFKDLKWSDFQQHLETIIQGAFYLAQAVTPIMEAAHYGKIIDISTQYVDSPAPNLLPYITAKSALAGFNKALALELAPKGIRVNSVSPGMTETDQIADVPERVRLTTAAKTPLRRLANPQDVAGAVSFLASDRSDYLAGETIRVNGGQVML